MNVLTFDFGTDDVPAEKCEMTHQVGHVSCSCSNAATITIILLTFT